MKFPEQVSKPIVLKGEITPDTWDMLRAGYKIKRQ
jgi:hypothetical protein